MLPWSRLARLLPVGWQKQREHLTGLHSPDGVVLLVHQCQGSSPHHSNSSLSILTNMMLMQAMGGTGNQMFLPAAALFSNRQDANIASCSILLVPVHTSLCSAQFLIWSHWATAPDNVHLYIIHHVYAPSYPSPLAASMAPLLSAVPKDVCASYGLPLSECLCPCCASCLQSQHNLVPSSHGTKGICSIPLEEGLADAHVLLSLYYHLVHNQGSFPTAHSMFALSSLCGSLYPLWHVTNPLKYLFHSSGPYFTS